MVSSIGALEDNYQDVCSPTTRFSEQVAYSPEVRQTGESSNSMRSEWLVEAAGSLAVR
jgi:hypothetical protein